MNKKVVAIATWVGNDSLNYGSILQTTALQQLIRENGCYPVTFVHGSRPDGYRKFGPIKKIISFLKGKSFRKIQTWLKCRNFLKTNNRLSKMCLEKKDVFREIRKYKCNIFLCGSDAIWKDVWIRPLFLWDYEELKNQPKISYAPSMQMGNVSYDLKTALEDFVAISGRETKMKEILSNYTSEKVEIVLDPTLAVDKGFWEQKAKGRLVQGEYIICYFLSDADYNRVCIREIAKKLNIKNIIYIYTDFVDNNEQEVYVDYRGMDYKKIVGPQEFLSLIKYAKCVCTDSFHGVAFSIVFNRQFYLFERGKLFSAKEDYRLLDLFERLHIPNRYVIRKDAISTMESIDYEKVKEYLQQEQIHSRNYLATALKKASEINL